MIRPIDCHVLGSLIVGCVSALAIAGDPTPILPQIFLFSNGGGVSESSPPNPDNRPLGWSFNRITTYIHVQADPSIPNGPTVTAGRVFEAMRKEHELGYPIGQIGIHVQNWPGREPAPTGVVTRAANVVANAISIYGHVDALLGPEPDGSWAPFKLPTGEIVRHNFWGHRHPWFEPTIAAASMTAMATNLKQRIDAYNATVHAFPLMQYPSNWLVDYEDPPTDKDEIVSPKDPLDTHTVNDALVGNSFALLALRQAALDGRWYTEPVADLGITMNDLYQQARAVWSDPANRLNPEGLTPNPYPAGADTFPVDILDTSSGIRPDLVIGSPRNRAFFLWYSNVLNYAFEWAMDQAFTQPLKAVFAGTKQNVSNYESVSTDGRFDAFDWEQELAQDPANPGTPGDYVLRWTRTRLRARYDPGKAGNQASKVRNAGGYSANGRWAATTAVLAGSSYPLTESTYALSGISSPQFYPPDWRGQAYVCCADDSDVPPPTPVWYPQWQEMHYLPSLQDGLPCWSRQQPEWWSRPLAAQRSLLESIINSDGGGRSDTVRPYLRAPRPEDLQSCDHRGRVTWVELRDQLALLRHKQVREAVVYVTQNPIDPCFWWSLLSAYQDVYEPRLSGMRIWAGVLPTDLTSSGNPLALKYEELDRLETTLRDPGRATSPEGDVEVPVASLEQLPPPPPYPGPVWETSVIVDFDHLNWEPGAWPAHAGNDLKLTLEFRATRRRTLVRVLVWGYDCQTGAWSWYSALRPPESSLRTEVLDSSVFVPSGLPATATSFRGTFWIRPNADGCVDFVDSAGRASVRIECLNDEGPFTTYFDLAQLVRYGDPLCGAISGPPMDLLMPAPVGADYDLSGGVTIEDAVQFLGAFAGGEPHADQNNDGVVTIDDIVAFSQDYARQTGP